MVFTRISLELPPNIDVTKATLAYGRLAIKRLNRELTDEILLIRQRAVKSLCDYLHDPEHICEALKENTIISLMKLLKDDDIPIRKYASECFVVLARRYSILNNNVLNSFASLISCEQPDIVRLNTQKAIKLLTINPFGAKSVVDSKFVPLLIECAEREMDEIKILDYCLAIDTEDGFNTNAMVLFTSLLNHKNPEVRARSAQNIARLSVTQRGKQEALDNETIPALVSLLSDLNDDVKASAAGSLAFICTTNHGRYTTINVGAIPLLLNLVNESSSHVRVNAFKVIACLSEAPEGRRILLDYIDKLSPYQNDLNASVAKHATIAVNVITWKP